MPDLGDLLLLLHEAGRFRTARAEFRGWRHHERASRAFQAMAADGSATVHVGAANQMPATSETTARMWVQQPDRVRVEREGGHFAIKVGENWWSWTEHWGASTNVGATRMHNMNMGEEFVPYLIPGTLLGSVEWSLDDWSGGEIRATGVPRRAGPSPKLHWELSVLGSGADSYAFVVDEATGVLKRVEACFEDEPFQISETVDFALDEEFAPETFVFEAPDGSEPTPLEMPTHAEMPVSEIIGRVEFPLLVPAEVPAGWRLTARYMPARARMNMPESVWFTYQSPDATHSLSVSETALADRDRQFMVDGNWEDVERDGRLLRVRRRSEDWPQAQLYTEVGETAVMMTSDSESADDLIAYALGLKAAT